MNKFYDTESYVKVYAETQNPVIKSLMVVELVRNYSKRYAAQNRDK